MAASGCAARHTGAQRPRRAAPSAERRAPSAERRAPSAGGDQARRRRRARSAHATGAERVARGGASWHAGAARASSRSSNAGRLVVCPLAQPLTCSLVGSKICHQHLAVGPLSPHSVRLSPDSPQRQNGGRYDFITPVALARGPPSRSRPQIRRGIPTLRSAARWSGTTTTRRRRTTRFETERSVILMALAARSATPARHVRQIFRRRGTVQKTFLRRILLRAGPAALSRIWRAAVAAAARPLQTPSPRRRRS